MKSKLIPDDNHVSRFCDQIHFDEEGEVTGANFSLRPAKPPGRPSPEKELSVDWLEVINTSDLNKAIEDVKTIYERRFRYGFKGSKIAKLHTGNTVEYVKSETPDDRVLTFECQAPKGGSHSAICGFSIADNNVIPELIAQSISSEDIYSIE